MLKNSISVEDFNEAILLLEDSKSLEDVRNVILTGWLLNCFNPSNEEPLRRLLLLNFHNSHEDIVDLFQTMWNNSAKNIYNPQNEMYQFSKQNVHFLSGG